MNKSGAPKNTQQTGRKALQDVHRKRVSCYDKKAKTKMVPATCWSVCPHVYVHFYMSVYVCLLLLLLLLWFPINIHLQFDVPFIVKLFPELSTPQIGKPGRNCVSNQARANHDNELIFAYRELTPFTSIKVEWIETTHKNQPNLIIRLQVCQSIFHPITPRKTFVPSLDRSGHGLTLLKVC